MKLRGRREVRQVQEVRSGDTITQCQESISLQPRLRAQIPGILASRARWVVNESRGLLMPDRGPCPYCGRVGLIRSEYVVKAAVTTRLFCCGACDRSRKLSAKPTSARSHPLGDAHEFRHTCRASRLNSPRSTSSVARNLGWYRLRRQFAVSEADAARSSLPKWGR
jgi:transcription elongation factor Elf1